MIRFVLSSAEFFELLVYGGMLLLLAVCIPVQIAAKWRRVRRSRVRITCRLCGYRFLRTEQQAICPHCGARNR